MRPPGGPWVVRALAVLAVCVLAYWALGFFLQRSLLYPAPPAPPFTPERLPPGTERLWVEAGGSRVESWLLPPLQGAEAAGTGRPYPLILFTHGNGELIDFWVREMETLRRWGLGVLLVEYPGYGRSSGSPSQGSITAATVAAYDLVAARPEVDAARIVGYGRSLGGGAVAALSRRRELAALVLESTFTSVRPLALRGGLPGFLVRDPFDNLAAVRAYQGPILILHGERDRIIPTAHGRELAAAAEQARFQLLPCGHNDCPRPWPLIRSFLAENGLAPGGDSAAGSGP